MPTSQLISPCPAIHRQLTAQLSSEGFSLCVQEISCMLEVRSIEDNTMTIMRR